MSSEEKVLIYSILSLVGNLVPSLPDDKEIENLLKMLGLIASVVFYSLAMSEIKKIKKNVYYKLSIAFLILTSYIYVRLLIMFIVVVIGGIGIFLNFRILVPRVFPGVL